MFRLNDEYTANLKKIIREQDVCEKKTEKLDNGTKKLGKSFIGIKNSSETAASGIGAIALKIGGIVTAAAVAKKAVGLLFDAVKEGAQEQVQLNNFQALMGSKDAGMALFGYAGEYAKKSALDRINMEKAVTGFLPYTKDIDQIQRLIKLTERLYAKDPNQGADGATFAMKEAFAGDIVSLRNRFNMTGISGEKVRQLSNSGDINGTINYLDEMFNKFGATQEIVDKNFKSLTTQSNIFSTNFKAAMADEANPAVQNLSQTFMNLNAQMQAGNFQGFFDLVANGANAVANGIGWLAQNINTIAPAIAGVIGAIAAYKIAMDIAKTVTLITAITVDAATMNWIGLAAAIAGAAGAGILVNNMMKSSNSETDKQLKSAEEWANSVKKIQSKTGGLSSGGADKALNTKITNSSPISVKGEVEIEKESQKYFFDIAAQKAIAMFNMQQVTPQVTIQNQTVTKSADLEEINQAMGDMVYQNSGTQAQGVYS